MIMEVRKAERKGHAMKFTSKQKILEPNQRPITQRIFHPH